MKRYVIVMLLALGFSFVANAQAPAEDDSPGELSGRIEELCRQGPLVDYEEGELWGNAAPVTRERDPTGQERDPTGRHPVRSATLA